MPHLLHLSPASPKSHPDTDWGGDLAEPQRLVSDKVLDAFAELVGLIEKDDRLESFSEQVERYAFQARTLHTSPVENALPPDLTFRPPEPESSDSSVRFAFRVTDSGNGDFGETLAFASLSQLSRLLSSGQLSPVELAELYLDRLASIGEKLTCVVTITEDLGLQQAREAEQELVDGRSRGPLHGIPWGAKDLLATRGIPTTWGATPYRNQQIDEDATVVTRLGDAGAALVAKLSMGSLASGDQWFEGMTRNPWNQEEGSGGSSAGPGAATAAGLVGFSIGTETHGSITNPSHRCGVSGLRPTFGRVSRAGSMALSYSLDKIGPMCRSAEDCAAVFAAIAGADERDSVARDAPFTWPPEEDRQLLIGIVEKEYEDIENEEEKQIDQAALDVLKDLGMGLRPVELPGVRTGIMLTIWVEAAAVFDDLSRSDDLDLLKEHDNSRWPEIFRAARTVSAVDYVKAQQLRTQLVSDFCAAVSDVDAIVCPGTGDSSMTASNFTGHPSLTIPVGFVNGMPRAMTIVGHHWDEQTILEIGDAYQRATDWHCRRPPLDES